MLALVAAVEVLAGTGCRRAPPPRNVVLVSLDTLRPDHLGCYGYGRDTSPNIDRLAAEGVLFETVVSSTSWTLPAHHALLTSLPDPVHGVLWDNHRLDEARITLAEVFREHGFRTGGVFTAPYLLPRFGFAQGFDDYLDATRYDKRLRGPDVLVASEQGRTTPGALDRVASWLDRDRSRPFFLFLHLFDIHPDLDPPPPFDTMFDPDYSGEVKGRDVFHNPAIRPGMTRRDLDHLIALYDGEIRYVDEAGIGRLVELLDEHGLLDSTLLVITADHGEEFFEHGRFGHRWNLYDTTLRVPLVLWAPGLVPAGVRVPEMARIIDVMPTILELAGLPQSREGMGRSLVPAIGGRGAGPVPAMFAELTGGNLHVEALRGEGQALVLDYEQTLLEHYDLVADPLQRAPETERSDPRVVDALGRFQNLREGLAAYRRSLRWGRQEPEPMDPTTRQRLESLGYLEP